MRAYIFLYLSLLSLFCARSAEALPFETLRMHSHRYIIEADPSLLPEYIRLLPEGVLMGALVLSPPDAAEIRKMAEQGQANLKDADLKTREDAVKMSMKEFQRREKHFSNLMGQMSSSQAEESERKVLSWTQIRPFVIQTFARALWISQDFLNSSKASETPPETSRSTCFLGAKRALSKFLVRFEGYANLDNPRAKKAAALFQLPNTYAAQVDDLMPFSRAFNDYRSAGFPCIGFLGAAEAENLRSLKLDLYESDHDQIIVLDQLARLPSSDLSTYIQFLIWAFTGEPNRVARYLWQKSNQLEMFEQNAHSLAKQWSNELLAQYPQLKDEIERWQRKNLL